MRLDKLLSQLKESRLYPPWLLSEIRNFPDLFSLWWLFFDEKYSTEIGIEINCSKFSLSLTKYLRSINSNLENLTISYNWILRSDFKNLLHHFKRLESLTVFATFGAENKVLKDISNTIICLKSFKFGDVKNFLSLKQDIIEKFAKTQQELCDLDFTFWSKDPKIGSWIFSQFPNLKKAKMNLDYGAFLDSKSNFKNIEELILVGDEFREFSWLEAFQFPKSAKICLKDSQQFIYNPICEIFTEVENLTVQFPGWAFNQDWFKLEKLSVNSTNSGNSVESLQVKFPLLREAKIQIENHDLPYSVFSSLVFLSKNLETLIIYFTQRFYQVIDFDPIDFEEKLAKVKYFNFKVLHLVNKKPNNSSVIPFDAFVKIIDKSPKLAQVGFNLDQDQESLILKKGFAIV